jgi:23S rRNA (uridine2552-2'-O)-methyltransferase
MARSKSSSRWISRHMRDHYVTKAKAEGYRSRAVYKLQEIDSKYQIFHPNQFIVDLGAWPGAWCQYVVRNVAGTSGKVIGLDILEMEPIEGVCFIQGDFTEDETLEQLVSSLNNHPVDLVLSDIAPNISGNKAVDQPKSMYLAELALDFARQNLVEGGVFAVKLFQGEGYAPYIQDLRSSFKRVTTFKPQASRKESREMYAVARDFEL